MAMAVATNTPERARYWQRAMTAPLIGVTGPARGGRSGWLFSWLSLRAAGARARRLRPPFHPDKLKDLCGIVIGGGANIDPARYQQLLEVEDIYDAERDEFEWQVMAFVMERRLPLLGICRGAQLLNVFAGGSLWQDLTTNIPGANLRRSVLARKSVTITPNTLLADVMRVHAVRVNSLHRQGIKQLGANLCISARDAEGIVQAVEALPGQHPFRLGVQWHPEYLMNRLAHRRLFTRLAQAAARL